MHHYPASLLRLLRMFAGPAIKTNFSVSGNLGKTDIGGNETSTNPFREWWASVAFDGRCGWPLR